MMPKYPIRTLHDPPPIPLRQYDWQAYRDGWDLGAPIGYGRTEDEAVADPLVEEESALEER